MNQAVCRNIRAIISDTATPAEYSTGVTRDEYRSMIGLNPSSLAAGLVGHDDVDPLSIKMAWEKPDEMVSTIAQQDQLDRGTLAHLMVLQPELVEERVAVWHGGTRNSNDYDKFKADNQGKLLITAKNHAFVANVTKDLKLQKDVADLLRGIDCEVAMIGSDECRLIPGHMGLKGQVDGVNFDKCIIVDLKTTGNGITERKVQRTIRDFHNREKMAMYRRMLAKATGTRKEAWECWNIFLAMSTPPRVVLEKFTSDALDWGEERMLMAKQRVEECLAAKEWPMYVRKYFMGVDVWEMDDGEGDVNYDE